MFTLPVSQRYRLARPPLTQALAQIRFDVRARFQSLEGIAPIQEELDALFPYMAEEHVEQISLLLGPAGLAGAPQGESARVWKFSDDAGWSVTIGPDVATLAVGNQYQSVDDIAERFRTLLDALSRSGGVRRCTRLGVRYINLAETPPGEEGAWRRWFRPELTGWVGGDVLAADLVASVTQTQLSARPTGDLSGPPGDIQAIIRHGYVPPNTLVPGMPPTTIEQPAYLIDLDLFIQTPQPWVPEQLSAQFALLHGQIDRFFRWTLAPEGERYFGLEEMGE